MMVVGPDAHWDGQTREQAETAHWAVLERKLQDACVDFEDGELATLTHDVEMSDRLATVSSNLLRNDATRFCSHEKLGT